MRLALAGDTMLGRKVAEHITAGRKPWSDAVAALVGDADLALCNLECCISERGERWPDPGKPFFFRAPPVAAELLAELGIDAVTLANNHALDYGRLALRDTLDHLDAAGIAHTGAGSDVAAARRPALLEAAGLRLAVAGLSDHPAEYAAAQDTPGIAYANLASGVPVWVGSALGSCAADVVVVTPHWGPNMVAAPVPHVRAAAQQLAAAGAHLVAGHSAHCFHGVARSGPTTVCYDLGDFVDDYAVHPERRNDLGLLWFVEVDERGVTGVEAVPLHLDYCVTRVAGADDAATIERRLRAACAPLGTGVRRTGDRLVLE